MTVPDRRESAALLLSLDPPEWHLRHSRAVAEVAAWLARRASAAGSRLDRRLVESAALLHDADKTPTVAAQVKGISHAEGSAAWLARSGYGELGPIVAGHPVTRMADAGWFENWLATAPAEALIVSYADKRAGQRLESMAARFGSWERRYPAEVRAERARGTWTRETLDAVWRRAERLELRVCEMAGVAPDEVRRLRWTSAALRAATEGRSTAGAARPAGA
jgi:putative nucleotidyltransferase with HDIG domain